MNPAASFLARIVSMQVSVLTEDAEAVKRSLFGPDNEQCWYLDHHCPLGPIQLAVRLPTEAEESAARESLDVEEPEQEADDA